MKITDTATEFPKKILHWYDQNARQGLPWREEITPYRVWVSEVMLQQTQVKTVIPYFLRFMQRFPTVAALAQASEDEVLHFWTGLGYYSRARNLLCSARMIMGEYAGNFPSDSQELQRLPGVGRSTANAIASIAFHVPLPILDGNVKRILARVCSIHDPINDSKTINKLWRLAEERVSWDRPADYTQAIMDLGAVVCTRANPFCFQCPLKKDCRAHDENKVHELPRSQKRHQKPVRTTHMLIFHDQAKDSILLEKRPSIGIWSGLWSFPEIMTLNELNGWASQHGCVIHRWTTLPLFKHVFTHFELQATPVYIDQHSWLRQIKQSEAHMWYQRQGKNEEIGYSASVKKWLRMFV